MLQRCMYHGERWMEWPNHHGLECYRPELENWAQCVPKCWCRERELHHSIVQCWPHPKTSHHAHLCISPKFLQNNATFHMVRVTMDFLHQPYIRTMLWPALSLYFNAVEHMWNEIQRQLNQVVPRSTTCVELEALVLRVWAQMPLTFGNHLMPSK